MMTRPKIDMIEATRLTRQGKLKEAMAVLRGAPHAAPATAPGEVEGLHIIDVAPPSRKTENAWTAPNSGEASSALCAVGPCNSNRRADSSVTCAN